MVFYMNGQQISNFNLDSKILRTIFSLNIYEIASKKNLHSANLLLI